MNELSEIATKQFSEIYNKHSDPKERNKILLLEKRKEILKNKNYGK